VFLTADQILAHLVGDYLLQSHWMATAKTSRNLPAALHAVCYGLPFLLLRPSPQAWAIIVWSHFVVDRWRLARHVVWVKNLLAPAVERRWAWVQCRHTGYPPDTPVWLATGLLIVADNTLHLLINAAALRWL
jgi:hypothetical protein